MDMLYSTFKLCLFLIEGDGPPAKDIDPIYAKVISILGTTSVVLEGISGKEDSIVQCEPGRKYIFVDSR